MPEIPDFQAQPVAIAEPQRSYVSPEELAEPGRAIERAGGQLSELSAALGRLAQEKDYQYVSDQWANATTNWHDKLQNGIDQAKQTGDYQGFAANLRSQLDQDLQTRLDNAPSGAARSRLQGHFATLTDEISTRASLAEHGMGILDHDAKRSVAQGNFTTQAYRDPTVADSRYAQGMAMIAGDAQAGYLNPEQRQKEEKGFGASLYGAAIEGRMKYDPAGVARDLESGRYDQHLSPGEIEQLQPKLGVAIGKMVHQQGAGGSPDALPPQMTADQSQTASTVRDVLTARGWSGPAIQAVLANGMAESGLQPWGKPGAVGERGIWQMNPGSHLPIYLSQVNAEGVAPEDPGRQTQYMADWVDKNMPGFAQMTDPKAATDRFMQQFERPANPVPGSRYQYLPGAGRLAQANQNIDAMNLSPVATEAAKDTARRGIDADEIDAERERRDQLQTLQDNSRDAENQIIADLYAPQPQMTAQKIANDPRLLPDARLRMLQLAGHAGGGEPAPGPSHLAALGLLNRMRLPDGDPNKITSDGPIYDALVGNQVGKADFDFVKHEFDQAQIPGGEIFAKRKAEFLKAVAPEIDPKGVLSNTLDAQGGQRLYQLDWLMGQKADEYRAQGKNPLDLLDPSKPDYMGKPEALQPYRSQFVETMKDAGAPAGRPAAPVPPRQAGETPAAYLARIGHTSPSPTGAGPQVPVAH